MAEVWGEVPLYHEDLVYIYISTSIYYMVYVVYNIYVVYSIYSLYILYTMLYILYTLYMYTVCIKERQFCFV